MELFILNFKLIGIIFAALVAVAIILLSFGLILVYIFLKIRKIFFPNFILFVIELFYVPAKKITNFFGGNDEIIDIILIDIRNVLLKEKFSETPYNKRIIIVPQCLRNMKCPARLNPEKGLECVMCGKCKIYTIKKKAEELGYMGVYIMPGGTFVKRILKRDKPKAILGVACPYDLNEGMYLASKYNIPSQGVLLTRTGCVNTDVDMEELFEKMELKKENNLSRP